MRHAEQPSGGRHGLQLWTSLPPALKLSELTYASFRAADIPQFDGDGARTRVIAGTVNGVEGPMKLATPTLFAHVRRAAGTAVTLDVDSEFELDLYVLQDHIQNGASPPLSRGTLALLTQGDEVRTTATDEAGADVALLGGPFVMDTPQRLAQAKRDFASGAMGTLDGVPF